MARGGRVENDEVVVVGFDVTHGRGEGGGLVYAGDAGEPFAKGLELARRIFGMEVLNRRGPLLQLRLHDARGVDFHDVQVGHVGRFGHIVEWTAECVGERMGGIGADQQGALVAVLGEEGGDGRGGGGFADAAFAADEDEFEVGALDCVEEGI